MRTTKKTTALILAGLIVFSLGITSCKKKEGCTDPNSLNYDQDAEKDDGSCKYNTTNNTYTIPTTYNFTNVKYSGQTARLLLLQNLSATIAEATTRTVTEAELLAIYENTAGLHTDISTGKKLSDKCESAANTQVRAWFAQIETLSGAAMGYTTADSIDLKQMIEKTLMGAVFFSQAANNYLQLVSNDDNSTVTEGEGTTMEHHWDEAFGYFGAARDYNNYTDAEIKSPGQKDANGDATINSQSEKCFYYGQTAAKRDIDTQGFSASSKTDFTKALFDAWLAGRAAISNKNYENRDKAKADILLNWEKIIAATVIHYLNDVKSDIATGASASTLNTHWAEMKGYFNSLQYYSGNRMAFQFIHVNARLGNKPSDVVNNLSNLDNAASTIKQTYGFTQEQVDSW